MSNWREDRNLGPWNFTIQPNKFGFVNNPRWTDEPADPDQHKPEGYWYRANTSFKTYKYDATPWVIGTLECGSEYLNYVYVTWYNPPSDYVRKLYRSADWGQHWIKEEINPDETQYDQGMMQCSNSGKYVYMTGYSPHYGFTLAYPLYKSTDYGRSWTFSKVFRSLSHIIVSGNGACIYGLSNMGISARSLDYGNTWYNCNPVSLYRGSTNYTGSITLFNGNVSAMGLGLYRSANYCIGFNKITTPYEHYRNVKIASNSGIAIVTPGGGYWFNKLMRSENYGITWETIDFTADWRSDSLDMTNDGKYAVVGCTTGIYLSKDYGKTWEKISTINVGALNLKISEDLIIMAMESFTKRLYVSFNLGKNWTNQGIVRTTDIIVDVPDIPIVWSTP